MNNEKKKDELKSIDEILEHMSGSLDEDYGGWLIRKRMLVWIIRRKGLKKPDHFVFGKNDLALREQYNLNELWDNFLRGQMGKQVSKIRNPMAFIGSLFKQLKNGGYLAYDIKVDKNEQRWITFTLNTDKWISTGKLPKDIFKEFEPHREKELYEDVPKLPDEKIEF